MLMKLKSDGASSNAGGRGKKGNKGRLELFAEKKGEEFSLKFLDFGNYGRVRWTGDFGTIDAEELDLLIFSLIQLQEGDLSTTRMDEELVNELIEGSSNSLDVSPEIETTAELTEELPPAEAQETEDTDRPAIQG